jgi:hypothetical protein
MESQVEDLMEMEDSGRQRAAALTRDLVWWRLGVALRRGFRCGPLLRQDLTSFDEPNVPLMSRSI